MHRLVWGNSVTITGEIYRDLNDNYLCPAVENHPKMWFQQDGTTPHTATMNERPETTVR